MSYWNSPREHFIQRDLERAERENRVRKETPAKPKQANKSSEPLSGAIEGSGI